MKRLEIGCGTRLFNGYDGLDVLDIPGIKYPGVDARQLPIEDGTYDEVFSHWVLEHFAWREMVDLLKEWGRVLRPGGFLRIVTNNQAAHNKCLAEGEIDWKEWVRLTYGVRYGASRPAELADCHKIGFTENLLREFLEQAEFVGIDIKVGWKCRELDGSVKCPGLTATARKATG